jgi:hypothetical protein
MDFVIGLPASKGFDSRTYNSVIVVVDCFSMYVRYLPYSKDIDALALAQLFMNRIVLDSPRGTLESLVTDRGAVFTSVYWANLTYILHIKHQISIAFHP